MGDGVDSQPTNSIRGEAPTTPAGEPLGPGGDPAPAGDPGTAGPERTGRRAPLGRVGVVVIGRNEGSALTRCFDALPHRVSTVYADSGSSDGSPELARCRDVEVVELDPRIPYSAARGRNEGLSRLLALRPDLEVVQFVDGDTQLRPGWLEAGAAALRRDPTLGAVGGRQRERDAGSSVFKRVFDVELEMSSEGSCLGTAMYRVSAFREAGGFRTDLRAGEEPELCLRLRRRGWRIARL